MRFLLWFLLYIFIEIQITLSLGSYIGGFFMFVEIVISLLLAIFIFANFKHSLYDTLVSLSRKEVSQQKAMALNIGSIIGAIFLLLPGVFSDFLGLLLQLPFVYTILGKIFKIKHKTTTKDSNNEEIIDTKYITDEHGSHVFVPEQDSK